ncbi:MAG: hypothetical protein ACFFB0_05710 [Promethearchaeota archaeon]
MSMSVMYCPHCKMNVFTKKEDFRIGLAILLAIFTGGLGLLIYVAIYLDKPQNRCTNCNHVCEPHQMITTQSSSNYQLISTSTQIQNQKPVVKTHMNEEKVKFCYNCGVELDLREGAKFCPLCGSNTE